MLYFERRLSKTITDWAPRRRRATHLGGYSGQRVGRNALNSWYCSAAGIMRECDGLVPTAAAGPTSALGLHDIRLERSHRSIKILLGTAQETGAVLKVSRMFCGEETS